MQFICGLVNSEDLIWLSGDNWIVASNYSYEPDSAALYLVDPVERSYTELFPGDSPRFNFMRNRFADCPGAPDMQNFATHGLSLISRSENLHWLYVTTHGNRESVEVFEIDSSAAKPMATWVGCVIMPENASINSVVALEDGSFLTTRIADRGHGPELIKELLSGAITGFVYEWHPGGKVRMAPGTRMASPNGIVMSPEGKWVFVASWGRHQVVRYLRQNDGSLKKNATLELEFGPDNLRLTSDAKILATGHRMREGADCHKGICVDEWEVAEIDPESLTVRSIIVAKPTESFRGATVAIRGHGGLWLGSLGYPIAFVPEEAKNKLMLGSPN